MKLQIIVGTTRPNRVTPRLAAWVADEARKMADTTVEVVDLIDYDMPFLDEPASPRFNPDRHINQAAEKWTSTLNKADAYVFVTPEYNHSIPGVLKNAMDYLTWEMVKKPSSVVAHGSVGGARATMHLKEILSEGRSVVIPTQVAFLGRINEKIDETGRLDKDLASQDYGPQTVLKNMLEELKWYSDALAAARAKST